MGESDSSPIIAWMKQTQCHLALGDGDGLNFIAQVSGIAKSLIAHFSSLLSVASGTEPSKLPH
jgi:hypothetical protein